MIVGLGIDLVSVPRIAGVLERHGERFLARILTPAERAYVLRYKDPRERMAGRWAAKEAAFKALGTGLADGMRWHDAEILPEAGGKPVLRFTGKAAERARELGARNVQISISHCIEMAMAQVILEA
jgi:holo-[acyl-carrier protein] synthase